MKRVRRLVAGFAVMASVAVGSCIVGVVCATAASAATGCQWEQRSLFDGVWSQGGASINHVEGVAADIRTEHAEVCTTWSGHGNTSSAWVMIAEDQHHAAAAGRDTEGLAQVGFIQNPTYNGNPVFFFEDGATSAGTDYTLWHPWTTRVPGTTNTYAVLWSATCYCLQESINGTVLHSATWGDPYSYWGTPSNTNLWATDFLGETHDSGSDVPGSGGAATVFSNLKTQNSITDQVGPTACAQHGQNDVHTRWGITGNGSYGCQPVSIFTN